MEEEQRCEEVFDGIHEGNVALPELWIKLNSMKSRINCIKAQNESFSKAPQSFRKAQSFSSREDFSCDAILNLEKNLFTLN